MQLYALDKQEQLVSTQEAHKHSNYYCLECHQCIRLRKGLHRQAHFYHLKPNKQCHLAGKSLIHLQVQNYLLAHLPLNECQLEYRFSQIGRIADAAWIPQKIVFEVQCSFISAAEALQRNQDYQQIGWQVIWILHDQRYNQWRLTAIEKALSLSPHYFTNLDSQGQGIIYDQFSSHFRGIYNHKLQSLPIHIWDLYPLKAYGIQPHFLKLVNNRLKSWSYAFKGDLVDLTLKADHSTYLQEAKKLEALNKNSAPSSYGTWLSLIKNFFYQSLIRPYNLLLQMLVEKICR